MRASIGEPAASCVGVAALRVRVCDCYEGLPPAAEDGFGRKTSMACPVEPAAEEAGSVPRERAHLV